MLSQTSISMQGDMVNRYKTQFYSCSHNLLELVEMISCFAESFPLRFSNESFLTVRHQISV